MIDLDGTSLAATGEHISGSLATIHGTADAHASIPEEATFHFEGAVVKD